MSVFSHKNRQKSGTILTTVQTQQREQVHQNMFEHQNQTEAPLFDKEGLAAVEDMAVIKFASKKDGTKEQILYTESAKALYNKIEEALKQKKPIALGTYTFIPN